MGKTTTRQREARREAEALRETMVALPLEERARSAFQADQAQKRAQDEQDARRELGVRFLIPSDGYELVWLAGKYSGVARVADLDVGHDDLELMVVGRGSKVFGEQKRIAFMLGEWCAGCRQEFARVGGYFFDLTGLGSALTRHEEEPETWECPRCSKGSESETGEAQTREAA